MIVTKEEKTLATNPPDEIKDIDGVFIGVICNSFVKNPSKPIPQWIYLCSIYVPEVYGKYDYNAVNYPTVEIPRMADADDYRYVGKKIVYGYEPVIGDICKVAFISGCNNECRLIKFLYINDEVRLWNQNYILHGILSSDVVAPPEGETLKQIEDTFGSDDTGTDMLDIAYYITTGHHKKDVVSSDFKPGYLAPEKGADTGWWLFKSEGYSMGRNYFCTALTMPFLSYMNNEAYSTGIPVDASEHYNVMHVIKSLYSSTKFKDELRVMFTSEGYDVGLGWDPYNIYQQSKDDDALLLTLGCSLAYCNPFYVQLMFPGKSIPDNIQQYFQMYGISYDYNYAERLWDFFEFAYDEEEEFDSAFSKLLFKYREEYEQEWFKMIPTYFSGFCGAGKPVKEDDTKMKHTVILCLTICPWLAYPLIGYSTKVALSEELNNTFKLQGKDRQDWRSYCTYIGTDSLFTEVSIELNKAAKGTDPIQFVKSFRKTAKKVFGNGRLEDRPSASYVNPWTYFKFDEKFDRLEDVLPQYLEKLK